MGLTAKDPGGTGYTPPDEGVFQAVCYGLYDCGLQYSEKWDKTAHRVLLSWEIPELRMEIERDGKTLNLPRAISREYTLSLHKKAQLRKDLEAWRGRIFTAEELAGFDLQKILGSNCMIQVLHTKKDDRTYANITAIMPLMKQLKPLKPENPVKFFSFEDKEPKIPDDTPEWIINKIQAAKEWTGEDGGNGEAPGAPEWLKQPSAGDSAMAQPMAEDDIPF
jgi:hypothetical protein